MATKTYTQKTKSIVREMIETRTDIGGNGMPRLEPLNARLDAAGEAVINGKERDEVSRLVLLEIKSEQPVQALNDDAPEDEGDTEEQDGAEGNDEDAPGNTQPGKTAAPAAGTQTNAQASTSNAATGKNEVYAVYLKTGQNRSIKGFPYTFHRDRPTDISDPKLIARLKTDGAFTLVRKG